MSDAEQKESPAVEPEATEAEPKTSEAAADAAGEETAEATESPRISDTIEAPALSPAVADAMAQVDEWRQRAHRYAADMDNLRKRFAKEKVELRKVAAENLVRDLLPVVDNLERAVEHAGEAINTPLGTGVKMVLRQFMEELGKHGARTFDAKGEPFDPQVHEAMSQMPSDEVPPGHVAQVFQRGWYLGERLIRPAMVIVGMAMPEAAAKSPDTDEVPAAEPEADDEGAAEAAADEASAAPEPEATAAEGDDDAPEAADGAEAKGGDEPA
ncbi:MAG: nucleotide exchange factor GrpE [Myxococcales bacterium]|nr:nucleotide exchange factor GrpE [Myxococcales bacterium]